MKKNAGNSRVWILKYALLLLFALPLLLSMGRYTLDRGPQDWRTASTVSTGLLPPPAAHPEAMIRVYAAQTFRWRGIFATHCWIVLKERNAKDYQRYDYTGWGDPISKNRFPPDGQWFGRKPTLILAREGAVAARAIPRINAAIAAYPYQKSGDYRAWPGPNSNTFIAALLSAAPELQATLPTTALGKDFPYDGRWLSKTPSGTGWRVTLGGYGGMTLGWREGVELNILGLVLGLDLRRPALNLPGLGRFGMAAA